MSIKLDHGSGFTDVSTLKRHNGTSWVNISFARRYDGSKWVDMLGIIGKVTFSTTPDESYDVPIDGLRYICENVSTETTTITLDKVADGINQKLVSCASVSLGDAYIGFYDINNSVIGTQLNYYEMTSSMPHTVPSGTKKIVIYTTYSSSFGYHNLNLTVSGFTLTL